MLEDYKKYYYGRTDMTMLNDEKVYGSLGINLKKITTIVEGVGSLMLPNSLKAPLERVELIGNSVQGENPAPDNPQEIKSAGRKSKNLFDIADLRVGQVQKDGTINEKQIYYRTVILDVPQDGKYRITFVENNDYNMLYFAEMYTNGVYSNPYVKVYGGNSGSLISLKNGKNILSFRATKDDATIDFPKDHNIMIAEESETLDYESYGYFFDLKITGKNLLSNKPTDWMIGKTTSWGAVPQTPVSYGKNVKNAIATINVKSSTNYSFINKETNKLWVHRIIELDANGLGLVNHALYANESFNYKKYNFSTRSNTANIVFEIKKVDNTELLSTDIESNKIMLVEGEVNEPTPYEPYTEQSMQIVLDEPLRGVGEYKDVLTKDGVVRKIKRIVLDGSENWAIHKEKEATVSFSTNSFKFTFPTHSMMLVDKFAYVISGMNKEDVSWSVYGSNFYININKDIASNLESFKTWLSQNPVTVVYIATEPTTEPLPQSVQAQLQATHSENGTTHVFVDSGEVEVGIKVEYVVGA